MHYIFGDCILDTQRYELHQAGVLIPLPPKVFQVLAYLLAHGDRVVSKEELLEHLWPGQYVGDEALSSYIMAVRKVLGDDGHRQQLLRTVRRRGYRFVAPVEVREPVPLADPPRTGHLLGIEAVEHGPPPPPPPAVADPTSLSAPRAYSESKPVSVLCCALADTPTLAARLGPEGLYRMLQTVLGLAQEVVQHYAGRLTPYGSEGFTAVFGAPVAQEDHARRAVLTALELSQHPALHTLTPGGGMAVQMGVHSGLVVVGGLGQDPPLHATVVGAPVALALRLQQRAAPGTILLSAATYALVHAEVEATPCGTLDMDGSGTPVPVYTVHGLLRRHAGVAGRGPRAASPFVGRQWELALLHDRLAAACAGQGQVVSLVGEPGMGKTRLVTEFCRSLAGQPVTVYVGQCLSYGQITPYLPVRDLLRQLCGLMEGDEAAVHMAAVQQRLHAGGISAEEDAALVCQLLDLPVAPECLARLSPEARQARTFAILRHLIFDTAQQQPLVMVVENLHWSDATSAAWLTSLVERLADAAVLLLGTTRSGYQLPWGIHAAAMQFALAPLQTQDSLAVVQAVLGPVSLPAERLRAMVAQAGGNPFFLEELAWHAVEQGGQDTLGAVPETVHAVLAARMDRLPSEAKRLLQTAAVIGMQMTRPLLQAVMELSDAALHSGLTHLQAVELLSETRVVPELTYTFKHALIHEVAYQSLLKSTQQQVHQRTAQVLLGQFPDTVATQPELLAQHYTEAGLTEHAIPYWQRAGQHASDRSAYLEAISHVTTGIELLKTLPETPAHTQQALTLYLALGAALQITKGNAVPEVEYAYTQARTLCQQVDEAPELFPVLHGLYRFYLTRAQLHTAREIGETLLRLAQRAHDPALVVIANWASGSPSLWLGTLPAARQYLEEGIAHYMPDQHRAPAVRRGYDPGVGCRVIAAMTLWLLGYPAQALAHVHEALALAHKLSHPLSLAYARCVAAMVFCYRRDVPAVLEQAEAAVALSTAQGFPEWAAHGTISWGWARVMEGQGEAGVAQVRQGIAAWRATGATLTVPHFCTLLAEVSDHLGHPEDGLQALVEAHTLVEQQEERYWEAEVSRLWGVLLLRQTGTPQEEAETWLQRALDVSRRQEAKSLELRAAISLARLWQQQGKRAAARALLAPIYAWFTEGFDTTDLQDAKALLDNLA